MKNRIDPHLQEINIIGKLADLKDSHYRQTLALSAIIELLIDKQIFTREELEIKAAELDGITSGQSYPTT
jgi:hypothetical protein